MPVYLDDELLNVDGSDLQSALNAAAQSLADRGRVVVEVHLDDQMLVGEALDQQLNSELDESSYVYLYSAEPREIVLTALQQARELLEQTKQTQQEAADLFQQDQTERAMQEVSRVIDAWLQTQQAIQQSVAILGLNLDGIEVEGQSAFEVIQSMLGQLKQLRDFVVARDTVGLADAMAYEWPESVDRWGLLIDRLIQSVASE